MSDANSISRIVDVDGYVHLVDGKVICFPHGMYDLNDETDVDKLLALGEDLYVGDTLRAVYGKNTVCVLTPLEGESGGMVNLYHIDYLPEDVREVIRRSCDGYGE